MAEPIACPFCGYQDHEYSIQLHIEEYHTDDSPFVAREDDALVNIESATASAAHHGGSALHKQWVRCTRPGCGEYMLLSSIDEHMDLHTAMSLAEEEESQLLSLSRDRQPPSEDGRDVRHAPDSPKGNGSRRLQKSQREDSDPSRGQHRWLNPFSKASRQNTSTNRALHRPENPGRLGEKELGPYAYEESMPPEVRQVLISRARPQRVNRIGLDGRLVRATIVPNETSGLIGALADICALDRTNEITYLCHSSVRHIERLPCNGNFCGYWNVQMLLTYVQHMQPQGPQLLPDVIQMQDLIERAWDNGICAYGRIETGGVANTRKWIGTHEALALFTQIGVQVDALCFKDDRTLDRPAAEDLLDHVEALFLSSSSSSSNTVLHHGTSCVTDLPPLYFQRLGHSMTIVGLERKTDGSRNLLVFDPSFGTTEQMTRLLANTTIKSSLDTVLRAYRRSEESLKRWREFEIIVPHKQPNRTTSSTT